MPLGDLIQAVDEQLDAHARAWLEGRGIEVPPVGEAYGSSPWGLPPAARNVLKDFYLARFALAVAGKLELHASESLNWSRECGATYTELGQAIGLPRQSIQRKWGIKQAEKDAALNTIADAVATLDPPVGLPDSRWQSTPLAHNYDPESGLSAALVSVERGTGSSPNQVLLFNYGKYLGPATDQSLGFTRLLQSLSKDKMVAVEFKIPGPVSAGPPKALYTARFAWRNEELVWFGDLPPGVTSSIARRGY
ncbi:LppP/LprE family lipoprotein [Rhodococcus erythropolis]